MHLARRAWCRTYQMVFRIALPILPYTEPRILEHAEDVPAVLQKSSIQKVLIVTDPGIARLGLTTSLERALTAQGIGVTVYSETRANPTVSNVEEAAALYRENDCRAIIGFGGGSAMAAPRVWGRALRSQTSPSTRCAACCASTVSCRCLLRFPLPLVREAKSRSRRLSPMTRRSTSSPLTTLYSSRVLRSTTPSLRAACPPPLRGRRAWTP